MTLADCTDWVVLLSKAGTQRPLLEPRPILHPVGRIRRQRLALPCSSWQCGLACCTGNISGWAFVAGSAIVVSGWMVVVPAEVWGAMAVSELALSSDTGA